MAGKLIVDTIDTDNAFITLNVQQSLIATMNVSGIYSNTGVKMIGANGTVSNTAITGNIISSQITSVANTQITGNIISSQITSNPTLYGNVSVTGVIGVGGATTSTSGAGITFPATQSASTDANTLDDYEEGTWTPSLGGFTSIAYSTQTGAYTKIGNLVNIVLRISVSGGTRSGADLLVNNLPFTSASQDYSGGSWGFGSGVVASTVGMPQLRINNSATSVSFLNTAGAVLSGTDLNTATPTIAFSATYRV